MFHSCYVRVRVTNANCDYVIRGFGPHLYLTMLNLRVAFRSDTILHARVIVTKSKKYELMHGMRLTFFMNILLKSKIKLHVEAFPVTVAVRLCHPNADPFLLVHDHVRSTGRHVTFCRLF